MRRPATAAALAAVLLSACGNVAPAPLPLGTHAVEDEALSEMSGLVSSARHAGQYWSINDSGSLPRLFRTGSRGEALGRVWIRGAWLHDTETLARWQENGRDWILVGDVGDNRARRTDVVVHALAEPGPGQATAVIAWSLRFRYPDGARDVEGMAVDASRGELLVMSKRDRPARLYAVPLSARGSPQPVLARYLGSPAAGALDGAVTGLDLSDDGRELAVLTYRGLYLWRRDPSAPWHDVLAAAPRSLSLPSLRKAEAMALSARHDAVLVGSEQRPAPLWVGALSPTAP